MMWSSLTKSGTGSIHTTMTKIKESSLPPISIIIPALNEAGAIESTVKDINNCLWDIPHEIIVIDDGSTDGTGELAAKAGAIVVRHPAPGGYGNALKSGICAASNDLLAITDADATYPNAEMHKLYKAVAEDGFHMAVGARTGKHYKGGVFKRPARKIFTLLSEFSTGRDIPDVNSGMRVFRKQDVAHFYDSLCNGFSFTTTITLAYMLNGYFIKYIPIEYFDRDGKSKVRHFRDSLGSLQIIAQSIIYYNPLKIFIVLGIALGLCFLASLPLLSISPWLSVLFFLFCTGALFMLGLGFLATGTSYMADLLKDPAKRRDKYSHFIACNDKCDIP